MAEQGTASATTKRDAELFGFDRPGEIARERLRIQRVFEKYKLNPPTSEEEKIEFEEAAAAESELRYQALASIAKGEADDAVLVARAVLGDEVVA